MDGQEAERMRALWKSGRDKFQSFFKVLDEVRREVGNEALPNWCLQNLYLGMSVITHVSDVLKEADAKAVKEEMKAAKEAERDQRAIAKIRRQMERERLKAEAEAEIARLKKIRQEEEIEAKKAKDKENKRQRDRKNPKERGPIKSAIRARQKILAKIDDMKFEEALKSFKTGEELCNQGDAVWVEGSVIKSKSAAQMRAECPNDQDFGMRLADALPKLNKDDRAALVGLGRLEDERLRTIFSATASRSYQLIWRDLKPKLKLVENEVS